MSRYERFFAAFPGSPPSRESWEWNGLQVSLLRGTSSGGDSSTCIVLHGGGGNAELVAPIVAGLAADGLAALAPDLPGYGRTAVPPNRFRYETWVELAAALARREADRSGQPVCLFGLSMGGMLAYHAACLAPEAIAAIAATNLLDGLDPRVRAGVARFAFLGRAVGLMHPALDRLRVPIRWLCRMDAIANDPELARACATDPRGGGSRVPLGFLRTWLTYRAPIEPEHFEKPVLLLHPAADRWTPAELSLRFFERLAGPKRYVTLPNCGHAPVEEPGASRMREQLSAFVRAAGDPYAAARS